jgi:LPXTG-site transpeptidase (sortase) family protein
VVTTAAPDAPVRIMAKTIGMNVSVSNPTSSDVDVLDTALLKGAVRYPTSALLGVDGTVLLFGHSSYLPIVHNQNYKAFDGIQNLKVGETISVYSATREYRYSVVSVKLADATQDVVQLPATGKHLILVTCDSFTKKTNRFVVTADFVGTYSLGK